MAWRPIRLALLLTTCAIFCPRDNGGQTKGWFTKVETSAEPVPLPPYCKPIGPKNTSLFPRLVGLGGFNFEQKIRLLGAVEGLPPSYFDPRTRLLVGFAWWDGVEQFKKPFRGGLFYHPLPAKNFNRVLVLIRKQPSARAPNMGYMDPKVVLRVAKRLDPQARVTKRVVVALGIDLRHFDVVTMHKNGCVDPSRWCGRSGVLASRRGIKPFRVRQATKRTLLKSRSLEEGVLLAGDGGSVLRWPTPRSGVALLFFDRPPVRVAQQATSPD